MTLIQKNPDQLIKEDLIRQTLDLVISTLKADGVNPVYRQAYNRAIKKIERAGLVAVIGSKKLSDH